MSPGSPPRCCLLSTVPWHSMAWHACFTTEPILLQLQPPKPTSGRHGRTPNIPLHTTLVLTSTSTMLCFFFENCDLARILFIPTFSISLFYPYYFKINDPFVPTLNVLIWTGNKRFVWSGRRGYGRRGGAGCCSRWMGGRGSAPPVGYFANAQRYHADQHRVPHGGAGVVSGSLPRVVRLVRAPRGP